MRPIAHVPRHPLRLAGFGPQALLPADRAGPAAGAPRRPAPSSAGVAAHAFRPLDRPATAAVGLTIIAAGHRHGWPVAAGGSRAISRRAGARCSREFGGTDRDRRAGRAPLADLPAGRRGPVRPRPARGRRHPRRPAAAAGGAAPTAATATAPAPSRSTSPSRAACPWTNEAARRAGTVHLGGTLRGGRRRRADDPRRAHAGAALRPRRPAVPGRPAPVEGRRPPGLDATRTSRTATTATPPRRSSRRSSGSPRGSASGSSDLAVRPPAGFEAYNPNYVGGDIVTGANTALQLVMRPRAALDPYSTGVPGMYICSAATPPGAGAHGMCGANAAASALRVSGLR